MFELKYNLNSSLSFDDDDEEKDDSGEHNVVVDDVVAVDAVDATAAADDEDEYPFAWWHADDVAEAEEADDDDDDVDAAVEFLLRKWPTISREPFCSSGSILAFVTWRWVPANSSMRQRFGCHQQGVIVQYEEDAVRAQPSSG